MTSKSQGLTVAEQQTLLLLVEDAQDRVDRLQSLVEQLLSERDQMLQQLAKLARAAA